MRTRFGAGQYKKLCRPARLRFQVIVTQHRYFVKTLKQIHPASNVRHHRMLLVEHTEYRRGHMILK